MKKVMALLLCLAMIFAMGGCSLFTSGTADGDTAGGSTDVKITDDFTHKDPEGLEYATRYLYWSGENCFVAESVKEQYDVTVTSEYFIVYADKDDVALAQYTYRVMASEEDAANYKTRYAEQMGTDNMMVEGNVTLQTYNQEELAETIESYITWNVLDDSSAKSYVNMITALESLVEYIPE